MFPQSISFDEISPESNVSSGISRHSASFVNIDISGYPISRSHLEIDKTTSNSIIAD